MLTFLAYIAEATQRDSKPAAAREILSSKDKNVSLNKVFHHPVDTDYNLEYKKDFKPTLQKVKISDLVPTQHTVSPSTVRKYHEADQHRPPDVLHPNVADGYQIPDGHHRVIASVAKGKTHILVNVWGAPKE